MPRCAVEEPAYLAVHHDGVEALLAAGLAHTGAMSTTLHGGALETLLANSARPDIEQLLAVLLVGHAHAAIGRSPHAPGLRSAAPCGHAGPRAARRPQVNPDHTDQHADHPTNDVGHYVGRGAVPSRDPGLGDLDRRRQKQHPGHRYRPRAASRSLYVLRL